MPYFMTKPVVVEAHQVTMENRNGIAVWCGGEVRGMPVDPPGVLLKSVNGNVVANVGDWVIKRGPGDFCRCKKEVFSELYSEQ